MRMNRPASERCFVVRLLSMTSVRPRRVAETKLMMRTHKPWVTTTQLAGVLSGKIARVVVGRRPLPAFLTGEVAVRGRNSQSALDTPASRIRQGTFARSLDDRLRFERAHAKAVHRVPGHLQRKFDLTDDRFIDAEFLQSLTFGD